MEVYGWLKLAHVAVWGYWIGSDLVVNQLTHYLTHAERMSGPERNRLWKFLLDVDQHPRSRMAQRRQESWQSGKPCDAVRSCSSSCTSCWS